MRKQNKDSGRRKFSKGALVAGGAAFILFIGGVSIELVAKDLEGWATKHSYFVWLLFATALVVAVGFEMHKLRAEKEREEKDKPELTIDFEGMTEGVPQPEYLLILPDNHLPVSLNLTNGGEGEARVNRIEIQAGIVEICSGANGEGMSIAVPELSLKGGGISESGLEWKDVGLNRLSMDTPFVLPGGKSLDLPGLVATNNGEAELERLVGSATLKINLEARIYADQLPLISKYSIPLRVLNAGRLEDGDIDQLLDSLNPFPHERTSRRDVYKKEKHLAQKLPVSIMRDYRINYEGAVLIPQLKEKLAGFDGHIQAKPTDPAGHYERGHFLTEKDVFVEGLGSLDKAIELGLNEPSVHLDRATCLNMLLRPVEALEALDHAIAAPSADSNVSVSKADLLITKSALLLKLGRKDEALAACDTAVTAEPNYAPAYAQRGSLLALLDRNEEALAALDRAIELNPLAPDITVQRARILLMLKREDDAVAAIGDALRLGLDPEIAKAIALSEAGHRKLKNVLTE